MMDEPCPYRSKNQYQSTGPAGTTWHASRMATTSASAVDAAGRSSLATLRWKR